MTPIIWVTKVCLNYNEDSVIEFGKPCVIFDRQVCPLDVGTQIRIIDNEVLPHASENDLILTVGPMIMMGVLNSRWLSKFDRIQYLVWDASRRRYMVRWCKR